MNLLFRVLSIVIASLLIVHTIGCTNSNDEEEAPNISINTGEPIDETDDKPELTKSPFEVTDATFAKLVLESELPVVVYFWADWCPPCKWMAPIIKEVASENRETFLIAKVDADKNSLSIEKHQISAIPTFIVFRDGKVIKRFVGGMQKNHLTQQILAALNVQGN